MLSQCQKNSNYTWKYTSKNGSILFTPRPPPRRTCDCGKTGCLETVASATGFVRLVIEALGVEYSSLKDLYKVQESLTAKQVFDADKDGDNTAQRVIDEVAFHLGLALGNLSNGLNPEKIVIGGGVSRTGDFF